ncbi:hypothetical protein B0H16DRAFT_1735949 [Mycena metata]|uniref:Uncharacterized protein n=1 Tax=Mycena metata TaxID=1033252 RepID=A0AAD7HQB2_9AGAR|nr:hypothetical protein B0H16DRAFT_1735949 [Mycena metata]
MRREEHYSSNWAFQSAVSTHSQQYSLHHIIQIATADPDRVELSAEMRNIIPRLPPFSAESEQQYMQFFANYGRMLDEVSKHQTYATGNGGAVNSTSGRLARNRRVLVFRDGGGSVGRELSGFLEHNFVPDIKSPDWHQIRRKWIKELEKNPVLCPDHPLTEYQPLCSIRGLPGDKQKDLENAYQIYVQRTVRTEKVLKNSESSGESKALPRRKNWFSVARLLRESVTQAVWKFGGNRRNSGIQLR